MSAVLVLNQNYEPLNVCNARRALVLVDGGKAEVLEHAEIPIRTPNRLFPRPSVIRLVYMIKRPRPRVRLTRREMKMERVAITIAKQMNFCRKTTARTA